MKADRRTPFGDEQADRNAIWTMLVQRDSDAFIAQNWDEVAGDFIDEGFFGIDAAGNQDPAHWTMRFASLESYKEEWLRQASATSNAAEPSLALGALLNATTLNRIEIDGDTAIAHKKFDGYLPNRDGTVTRLLWQTIYVVRRISQQWKIASFIGYLPHKGKEAPPRYVAAEKQHKTAGPYSPAIGVRAGSDIIVLSGQAPLNNDGDVIGETIDEQTRLTLENCRTQLAAAGLTFDDVFKATVYMTDLKNWGAFNKVYAEYLSEPYPARTAIETGLLPGMLVEIEMWAVKP